MMAKRLIPILAIVGLLLSGCASHYVVTLNSGSRFTTLSKPRLEHGQYYYQDVNGRPGSVSALRVTEIAPASMASGDGMDFLPAAGAASR